MALRPPRNFSGRYQAAEAKSPLDTEIAAEKAASLGRASHQVEEALRSYRDARADGPAIRERDRAADLVYGFLIQRELLGLRDRAAIIRDFDVPKEILCRLGTSPRRL